MKRKADLLIRLVRDLLLELNYLLTIFQYRLSDCDPEIVVSMTSYPARIRGSWVAVESLFRQNMRCFRLVLVLAHSQFPGKKLPIMIRLMEKKGLEVHWVEEDNRSWDHLWPAYSAYPDAKIISVDDDKIFPPDLLDKLSIASNKNPGYIIGARGWEMRLVGGELSFGVDWVRATASTPSEALFMPPGNGSLYPPGSLPDLAGDTALMRDVCPRADDVWYWAMARLKRTPSLCLGLPAHRPSRPQSRTLALADEDPGPAEFAAVLKRFGIKNLDLTKLKTETS